MKQKESTLRASVLSTVFLSVQNCLGDQMSQKLEPKAGTQVSALAFNQGHAFVHKDHPIPELTKLPYFPPAIIVGKQGC